MSEIEPIVKVKETVEMNEEELKNLRKARFTTSDPHANTFEAKKILEEELGKLKKRAEKFGLPEPTSLPNSNPGQDEEKIKKRQERFGLNVEPDNEKIEARKKRFGLALSEEDKLKIQNRKERFSNISEEDKEKMAKRNARFATESVPEPEEDPLKKVKT